MDLIFVCIVAGGFVLYILYGTVRCLIDPEFKARIEKEAAEYRRKHPKRKRAPSGPSPYSLAARRERERRELEKRIYRGM